MADQYGAVRQYTGTSEAASLLLASCPKCSVKAVPRGITSTRTNRGEGAPIAGEEQTCPNCGHTYGRDTTNFPTKVIAINVTGAGGATTITVNDAPLQMSAQVLPAIATNKAITWSVVNGTGSATIGATGILQPAVGASNGTVTVVATAQDVSKTVGSLVVTLSNQA